MKIIELMRGHSKRTSRWRSSHHQRLNGTENLEVRRLLTADFATGTLVTRLADSYYFADARVGEYETGYLGRLPSVLNFEDVQAADVNGDGKDDIIGRVAESNDWWVTLGGASKSSPILFGSWSKDITWLDINTADVNGDGLDDIIGRDAETGEWTVGVSDGSAFSSLVWGRWAEFVDWTDTRVADLNGDGLDDIIGRVPSSGEWWVAESSGSGFITEYRGDWSTTVNWAEVFVSDVNGDGRDDLLGRDEANSNWWAGIADSSGTLNTELWDSWHHTSSWSWNDITLLDLNDDGLDDVIGRVPTSGEWWGSISNAGAAPTTRYIPGDWPTQTTWEHVAAADVNGDGISDIVGQSATSGAWIASISDGSGLNHTEWANFELEYDWQDFLFLDLDGDGFDGVAGRSGLNDDWWVGDINVAGVSQRFHSDWSEIANWEDTFVADFDGDHEDEIASRVGQTGEWWLIDDVIGEFEVAKWDDWSTSTEWHDVSVGDVNGDGRQDIVGRADNGRWNVSISTGESFTSSSWGTWTPSVTWLDVQTADVDGDGLDDIIGRAEHNGDWWVANSAGSEFNNQLFAKWTLIDWLDVKVADLNGDGLDDVIGRAATNGELWAGISSGTSFDSSQFGTWSNADYQHVTVLDFDRNGLDDIVGQSGTTWTLSLSGGTTAVSTTQVGASVPTLSHAFAAELGSDSFFDIAAIDEQTGGLYAVTSNGTNFSSANWGNWFATTWDYVGFGEFAAAEDPALASWVINNTGATGQSSVFGIDVTVSQILADVETVHYTDDFVYVHTSGVPSYSIGPFPLSQGVPTDIDATYKIPRNPVKDTSGDNTQLGTGPQAVFVNGVAYNFADGISYRDQGVWNQDTSFSEFASFFEFASLDDANGQSSPIFAAGDEGESVLTAIGGLYHHHQNPVGLRDMLEDDGSGHSPLLGFAFDGFPIYGPYGYDSPTDPSTDVVRIESSYQLRSIWNRTTLPDGTVGIFGGPTVFEAALGSYQEDFEYIVDSGHLDEHNGRFAITPDYPDGTYAYFVTLHEDGSSAFPHIVGPTYYGVVVDQDDVSVPETAQLLASES